MNKSKNMKGGMAFFSHTMELLMRQYFIQMKHQVASTNSLRTAVNSSIVTIAPSMTINLNLHFM